MSNFVNTVDIIGDEALTNSVIDRSVTEIRDNHATSVGKGAFYGCKALTAVEFLEATSIGDDAFYKCSALAEAYFPAATSVGATAFNNCRSLHTVKLPLVTRFTGPQVFSQCTALTTLDLPSVASFNTYMFNSCANITALILRATDSVCTLPGSLGSDSSFSSGTGYIYVPRALVDSYKAASNWSTYAAQFRALEDYTVDGTTTGALDETKI